MKLSFAFAACSFLCSVTGFAQAPSRPAITGIAFARFYAADAAASERFYSGTLGLQKLAAGNTSIYPVNALQWVETVPLPDPALKSRMAAVGFTTRNAAQLQAYVEAKGVTVSHPLHGGMFSVQDPEGNEVWFVQTGAQQQVAKMRPSANATSGRMIHVGYVVNDAAKEDAFYRDVLGFHAYWHGGRNPDRADWVSLQVPEGSDWMEYMLHIPPDANLRSVGVQDHFSLGTVAMSTVLDQLKANKCLDESCHKPQIGLDGKTQLNLYDPDLTRVEFMEYVPQQKPCCSPITGKNPSDVEER
ncbi:MAG: VOC family protein [Janthinobacterium lividum]